MIGTFVAAAMLALQLPVDCTPGKTCFIQNYVDHDAGDGWQDFRCRHLSYDGHKGTDIRLIHTAQMNKGVAVLAAADGRVKALRDGMDDVNFRMHGGEAIANRECGNGVLMEHDGGYVTQYCHLMQGSVKVTQGQRLKAGDVLGTIGLSGYTEFPHLHFELRDTHGTIIDPFEPKADADCNRIQTGWWSKPVAYQASGVLQAGIAGLVPTVEQARQGALDEAKPDTESPVMVVWAELFGTEAGDVLEIDLSGTKDEAWVRHRQTMDGNKAVFFQFAGKKKPAKGWQIGTYRGEVRLLRDGKTITKRKLVFKLKNKVG